MAAKKRVLTKWTSISSELKREIKNTYPLGFKHKMENVLKGKEKYIQVLPFETADTIYFIEIPFRPIKSTTIDPDNDSDNDSDNDYTSSANDDDDDDDSVDSSSLYAKDDTDTYTGSYDDF